jgi:hypothetical protein
MTRSTLLRALCCSLLAPLLGCAIETDGELIGETALELGPAAAAGYAFARDTKENRKSVPIKAKNAWRVVYSVPLQDLHQGERIAVRGEVQLTTCQASDLGNGPCKRVTPFDPKMKAKIVLGTTKNDAKGRALSNKRAMTCTHFKHHCTLAIDEQVTGDLSGFKFANLVVAATGSNPNSKDLMEVNAHHGGLYVTRIGASAPAQGKSIPGHVVTSGWMRLDMENKHPRKPHVTLQATVSDARPGDVIDAEALIVARTRGSGSKPAGCSGARDPLILHQVFVSTKKGDPLGTKIGTLTAKNGVNCKLGNSCTYRKSGAVKLPKSTPSTVHVSVISWGGRSCSAPNDEWSLGNASALKVSRRRSK